jgi:hypothetical protein
MKSSNAAALMEERKAHRFAARSRRSAATRRSRF